LWIVQTASVLFATRTAVLFPSFMHVERSRNHNVNTLLLYISLINLPLAQPPVLPRNLLPQIPVLPSQHSPSHRKFPQSITSTASIFSKFAPSLVFLNLIRTPLALVLVPNILLPISKVCPSLSTTFIVLYRSLIRNVTHQRDGWVSSRP
jgi:hypothetical protein